MEIAWLDVFSRWIHILSALLIIGGTFFMRVALIPAVNSTLDSATNESLRAALSSRWRKYVHAGFGLLLLTGFYNLVVAMKSDPEKLYHSLFGIKFLLALGLFYLGAKLVSRHEWPAWLKNRPKTWYTIAITVGILIVMIGGLLKFIPRLS